LDHFSYINGEMYAEGVPLQKIAEQVGTPFFCYSTATIERHYRVFRDAIEGLNANVFYAIKANSNIAIIATLARMGAGADVVSGGEFKRALAAGIPGNRIVFSGVGKSRSEMAMALREGVYQISVESEPELTQLSEVAKSLGLVAPIAIRINPDVDAKTHEKITTGKSENKFGVDLALARDLYLKAAKLDGIEIVGAALHIGSQLTSLDPYREAYQRLIEFADSLKADGIHLTRLDLGGGLGITYDDEQAPSPAEYGEMVKSMFMGLDYEVAFEPGRVIVGNAGVLVCRVLYIKEGSTRRFMIVDGAMNDLIRPTLYNAYHRIEPVLETPGEAELFEMDVVGPICESGDYLAKGRMLPNVGADEMIILRSTGAYASVMASSYNSRPLAPEVLVKGDVYSVIRKRVDIDVMINQDVCPDWLNADQEEVENSPK